MTAFEAYRGAAVLLEKAGIADAKTDAALLLEAFCGIRREGLYAEPERALSSEAEQAFCAAVQRRAAHTPLQHITGEQSFYGLSFHVTGDVLCPRQETELLVDTALSLPGGGDAPVVLDLCTGSGCILISILANCPEASGTGSDISQKALELAKENAARNGVEARCRFERSDLFEQVEGLYDVIVTNPPYIRSGDIPHLMEEVRDHEPLLALDGGADGLCFYRAITEKAMAYLKPGGWLLAEIGYDQGACVRQLFERHSYEAIEIKKDLAGLDRVVLGRKQRV